eukprot:3184094-Pleurochrysis_carterae.AAC.2
MSVVDLVLGCRRRSGFRRNATPGAQHVFTAAPLRARVARWRPVEAFISALRHRPPHPALT